ncbi:MAG: hypothetical protein GY789_07510 [Hyphomicrobiales bacterium]|nr:hypothetical protein [Hyphomicrobiales bacterium]MCP5002055.1 hypothetical protein [Hyphomicrobiales bacterium]
MRMFMLGLFGFIFAGLAGLQGLAVYKREDNAGKAMAGTIALYQESPSQTRRLIKVAVRECLENEAGGELPGYYTDLMSNLMVKTIRFAGDNEFDSTDDPKVQTFVAELSETTMANSEVLLRLLKREPLDVRKRMVTLVERLEGKPTAVARCMGSKVMRMSKDV